MKETESHAYRAWQKEATALREIGKFRNPHIIEVNAFMSKGWRQYFMFPWADGGNLQDFWRRDLLPILTVDFIRSILGQLAGLAAALEELHRNKYRHGDLKPENILVFEHEKQQGIWKLADLGLAKFHEDATQIRPDTTSNNYNGTVSYEPPEVAGRTGPRSRRYDIWCMGCITLQLVIWLLCGIKGHDEFMKKSIKDIDTGKSSFWKNSSKPRLHPKVTEMMDHLSKILKNETRSPALEALLDIIRSKMLVVQLSSRATADAFHSAMKEIQHNGQKDEEYWLKGQALAIRSKDTSPLEAHSSMDAGGQAGNSNVSIAPQSIILSDPIQILSSILKYSIVLSRG